MAQPPLSEESAPVSNLPCLSVVARQLVQRLAAVGLLIERREGLAHETAFVAERPKSARQFKPGGPGLFVRTADLDPLAKSLRSFLQTAVVPERPTDREPRLRAIDSLLRRIRSTDIDLRT